MNGIYASEDMYVCKYACTKLSYIYILENLQE